MNAKTNRSVEKVSESGNPQTPLGENATAALLTTS
jgi:hypothetical protein